jgi:hypothetical protein
MVQLRGNDLDSDVLDFRDCEAARLPEVAVKGLKKV